MPTGNKNKSAANLTHGSLSRLNLRFCFEQGLGTTQQLERITIKSLYFKHNGKLLLLESTCKLTVT